jgi:hypothetical protein
MTASASWYRVDRRASNGIFDARALFGTNYCRHDVPSPPSGTATLAPAEAVATLVSSANGDVGAAAAGPSTAASDVPSPSLDPLLQLRPIGSPVGPGGLAIRADGDSTKNSLTLQFVSVCPSADSAVGDFVVVGRFLSQPNITLHRATAHY